MRPALAEHAERQELAGAGRSPDEDHFNTRNITFRKSGEKTIRSCKVGCAFAGAHNRALQTRRSRIHPARAREDQVARDLIGERPVR
jgi:hypothetical protein